MTREELQESKKQGLQDNRKDYQTPEIVHLSTEETAANKFFNPAEGNAIGPVAGS